MPRVVVAGSENELSFAVIDFTNPSSPAVKLVNPGFGAGCHVTIGGNHAIAGNVLGGDVRVVDVSNPSAPVLQGNVSTNLGGIGAVAIRKTLVAAGELSNNFAARVVLIDISNPAAPVVVGTAKTPLVNSGNPAISSAAFISDNVVVVSGQSDFEIVQVDFTIPSSPVVTTFNPTLAGPPTIDGDAAGSLIAAGDTTSGILKWFDANSKALLGSINTMLLSLTSVSASSPTILVASSNEVNSVSVDITGPTKAKFNPGLGGGSVTGIEGTIGVCGAILGSDVALINLSGTPSVLGTANTTLASISTVAISTFTTTGPIATVSPNPLPFGAVHVGTPSIKNLTIKNTGGSNLSITNLASSSPRFTFSPAGPFNIAAGGSQVVHVTFTPNAEAPFSGNLTMKTNDPAHPVITVAMSGTGGLPHISVSPTSLNFGSVAICLSGSLPVQVHNSGAVPLTVSSAATSAPFSESPASLTVGAGASLNIIVSFTPTALGVVNGNLAIHSDDAANPVVNVALTGTGLPTPPPAIAVSPGTLNFGATPVQYYIGLRITVANTSPCQTLTLNLASSGAPFFVTDTDPTTLPPNSLTVAGSVPGNSSKRFVVVFAPTATGSESGTLTITSNDPVNPSVIVQLTGNGVQLNPASLELVLDRSGSMSAPAQSGTKMDGLKAAVQLFADLVIPGQGDEMGSVEFDDAFNVLTPFGTFDAAKQAAIKNDASGLTPRNFTSIGGGLQLGQTQVSAGTTSRHILLVFTDGLENTPPMISTAEPPILAAGMEVYAIGLGQPQNISSVALSSLAASSNGNFFLTDDTLILRKNFVQVLADAFRHNMAADPVFTVAPGMTTNIPVEITECERRITFVLNWDNQHSQLDLRIVAPDGTTYTPTSQLSNQLVRYGERPGYRYYQIAFPPLDPGSGLTIGPKQIGTWNIQVIATKLAGSLERCATSVLVESQLELRGIVHAVDVAQPIQVEAVILDSGVVVTNAEVMLTVTAPLKSLAAVSTPAVIQRALSADRHPIRTGLKPLIPTTKTKHMLEICKGQRTFTIQLPPPEVDGVYEFEFKARGKGCGGEFDRYSVFSIYIGRKVDIKRTIVKVQHTSATSAIVRLEPLDAEGVPLGPGLAGTMHVQADEKTYYQTIDLHDGSYAMRLTWAPQEKPEIIKLKIADVEIPITLGKQED